jgi:hypothetical protein
MENSKIVKKLSKTDRIFFLLMFRVLSKSKFNKRID